jgi:hypothetical protein
MQNSRSTGAMNAPHAYAMGFVAAVAGKILLIGVLNFVSNK